MSFANAATYSAADPDSGPVRGRSRCAILMHSSFSWASDLCGIVASFWLCFIWVCLLRFTFRSRSVFQRFAHVLFGKPVSIIETRACPSFASLVAQVG